MWIKLLHDWNGRKAGYRFEPNRETCEALLRLGIAKACDGPVRDKQQKRRRVKSK